MWRFLMDRRLRLKQTMDIRGAHWPRTGASIEISWFSIGYLPRNEPGPEDERPRNVLFIHGYLAAFFSVLKFFNILFKLESRLKPE